MADQPMDGNEKKVSDLDPHMRVEQNGLWGLSMCSLTIQKAGSLSSRPAPVSWPSAVLEWPTRIY